MATWTISDKFKEKFIDGTGLNLDTGGDTLKLLLATSAHAPVAADEFLSTATLTEVSGTNYTAGGSTLGSQTVTESTGTVTFDAADVTFAESGTGFSNARYVVIYDNKSGAAATSPIICFADLGSDKGNTGGDLTFSFNASGIFTIS